MVRIGIDALGGDNGETPIVDAIIKSLETNNDISITIIGNKDKIETCFNNRKYNYNSDKIKIVNASEKIEMNDHPALAIRSKPNSSICIAGNLLINNSIDIFISAGNTGALVALALFNLKTIEGVSRPVVATIIPSKNNPVVLIDSGCNVDSKPEWLYQFAVLGTKYYELVFNKKNPKVGLLSVGTEENKGNQLTFEAYKLIKENSNINFIGNIEARDAINGVCDVVVADGFSGNVLLKTYEASAKLFLSVLKKVFMNSIITKIAALLIKKEIKKELNKFDIKIYGGAPILGAKHIIIKCHGNSEIEEYYNAINQAKELINNNIYNKVVI